MKKTIAAIAFSLVSLTANAGDASKDYVVGLNGFNLFEFPSPIREAVLPNDAPLAGSARYVNGNKGVLLRFKKNASEPFQMVVMLKNGDTHMINLDPEKDVPGQTYKVGDFTKTVNRRSLSNQSNPNADFLPVMAEKLAQLDSIPKGFFAAEKAPQPRMFKGQTEDGLPIGIALKPVERLEGTVEGRKVFMDLFYLETSKGVDPKNLDPSQFTEKGVGAITITRDAAGKPFVLVVRNAG